MASNVHDLREYKAPTIVPQCVLSIRISAPTRSSPITSTSGSQSLPLSLEVRQRQSTHPEVSLTTVATDSNIFSSALLDLNILVLTNTATNETVRLYSASNSPQYRVNRSFEWGRDVGNNYQLVTIPSLASGQSLTLSCYIGATEVRELWSRRVMPKHGQTNIPSFPFSEPGTWKLSLESPDGTKNLSDQVIAWTWGDLENELKGKRFEVPEDPRDGGLDVSAKEEMKLQRQNGEYVQMHLNESPQGDRPVQVEADSEAVLLEILDGW